MNNTKPSFSIGRLAIIVPIAIIATPLLSFLLQKLANLLHASSVSVAMVTAVALFAWSLLVKVCKPLQPKGKVLRGLVLALCACPWVLRAIGSCLIAVFGTYLMGFWAQNLADFISREINMSAVLMSAAMYLASKKVSFAKKSVQDETPEAPAPAAQESTLDELSEELGEAFSADVADELADDFVDDEVLP